MFLLCSSRCNGCVAQFIYKHRDVTSICQKKNKVIKKKGKQWLLIGNNYQMHSVHINSCKCVVFINSVEWLTVISFRLRKTYFILFISRDYFLNFLWRILFCGTRSRPVWGFVSPILLRSRRQHMQEIHLRMLWRK